MCFIIFMLPLVNFNLNICEEIHHCHIGDRSNDGLNAWEDFYPRR